MARQRFADEDTCQQARIILFQHLRSLGAELYLSDIAVTWFNYTLGGWKAILCNKNNDDHFYYEVTFNKVSMMYYVDEYTLTGHNEYSTIAFN